MASLDAARAAAQRAGAWREPLAAARAVRAGLRALPGLALLEDCAPAGAPGRRARRLTSVSIPALAWRLGSRLMLEDGPGTYLAGQLVPAGLATTDQWRENPS
jgi:hypothetical protein